MKTLRYAAEALLLACGLTLFRRLGIERASALAGWLGRTLGPLAAGKQRVARRNLRAAFPEKSEAEIAAILTGMWDNIGRFLGEFPHLHELDALGGGRVGTRCDFDFDDPARNPLPAIYFTAHFGNFEVATLVLIQRGWDTTMIYRAASNPWSEVLLQRWRDRRGGRWAPKGREGARALLAAIRRKGAVAIVADQKLNEGLPIPFFGRDAMTAPAIAELALKHDAPLIPARVLRLPGPRFEVRLFKPLAIRRSGDREADIRALLTAMNRAFEDWIRENPDHWLWIHRRWPD